MVDAVLAAFVILEQTLHKPGHVVPDVKLTADPPLMHRRVARLINTLRRLLRFANGVASHLHLSTDALPKAWCQ
jgi:hypothetical protein